MQEEHDQSVAQDNRANLESNMLQWNQSYETVNLDDPRADYFDDGQQRTESGRRLSERVDTILGDHDARHRTGYFPSIGGDPRHDTEDYYAMYRKDNSPGRTRTLNHLEGEDQIQVNLPESKAVEYPLSQTSNQKGNHYAKLMQFVQCYPTNLAMTSKQKKFIKIGGTIDPKGFQSLTTSKKSRLLPSISKVRENLP